MGCLRGLLDNGRSGGKVTDFKNKKYSIYNKEILATNGLVHNAMLEVMKS